jgi:hypothetical protein
MLSHVAAETAKLHDLINFARVGHTKPGALVRALQRYIHAAHALIRQRQSSEFTAADQELGRALSEYAKSPSLSGLSAIGNALVAFKTTVTEANSGPAPEAFGPVPLPMRYERPSS